MKLFRNRKKNFGKIQGIKMLVMFNCSLFQNFLRNKENLSFEFEFHKRVIIVIIIAEREVVVMEVVSTSKTLKWLISQQLFVSNELTKNI